MTDFVKTGTLEQACSIPTLRACGAHSEAATRGIAIACRDGNPPATLLPQGAPVCRFRKDKHMAANELNPLYRTLVGFDRIASLMDQAARLDGAPGYPPFNVEQIGDDEFRIELAVAGFTHDDLTIEFKQNSLVVTG